jgi:lipopolysaccharide biosynthesis glycosyltransferase
MIRIFTGWDKREEIGWHTFTSSVLHNTKHAVMFAPVEGDQQDGSNTFTYARFMVPTLCGHKGWALFADGADMLVTGDIAELWELRDPSFAMQCVKHEYKTKHPRKYIGTDMESPNVMYPRKNWASLMLINCEHDAWRRLEFFEQKPSDAIRLKWLAADEIGSLPAVWNWLVDEYGEEKNAKLLHWTAGIPAFPHYVNAPMADEWAAAAVKVTHADK